MNNNYQQNIVVKGSPLEVYGRILSVHCWWKKDTEGITNLVGGQFTVDFGQVAGESSYVRFSVSELTEGKMICWHVTDCYLPWFANKQEWNNTDLIFEIAGDSSNTSVHFEHRGLVPEMECYTICEQGWNTHIVKDLAAYINEGKCVQ